MGLLDELEPWVADVVRDVIADRIDFDDFVDSDAYDAVYDYYVDSGEMPYDVMKARTATPDEWIFDRLMALQA